MAASIKKLREQADALGISLTELVSELERGGKPDKEYKIILTFDRMNQLVDFIRDNFAREAVGIYPATAIDSEYREFGRAPKNSYVIRKTDDPFHTEDERID